MQASEKKSLLAGLYGNALEWYDFMLYASFAPLFSTFFFKSENPFVSLIATFGVFAIGFFMRPIGGALLGLIGDKAGRKKALLCSVSIMTLSTFLIAFLPGYEQAGLVSPLLFTL